MSLVLGPGKWSGRRWETEIFADQSEESKSWVKPWHFPLLGGRRPQPHQPQHCLLHSQPPGPWGLSWICCKELNVLYYLAYTPEGFCLNKIIFFYLNLSRMLLCLVTCWRWLVSSSWWSRWTDLRTHWRCKGTIQWKAQSWERLRGSSFVVIGTRNSLSLRGEGSHQYKIWKLRKIIMFSNVTFEKKKHIDGAFCEKRHGFW